jgi:hypothetical protein
MSSLRVTLICAVMIAASQVCFSQPPASRESFLGTWTLSLDGTTCRETIEFRADGTAHVLSGSEVSLSQYAIVEIPKREGSYVLFDTILENNAKPDCLGHLTPIGDKAIVYLLPNLAGGYRFCLGSNGEACIGVLSRADRRY